jgi:hypothetical protein
MIGIRMISKARIDSVRLEGRKIGTDGSVLIIADILARHIQ